jgi:predicted Zn-dependent protease
LLDDAEAAARRAVALDPLTAIHNHGLALVLAARSRLAESERYARRAVELEPEVALFRMVHAQSLVSLGRPAAADSTLRAGGLFREALSTIHHAAVDPSRRPAGLAAVARWRRAVPDRVTYYSCVAGWYAQLGAHDSAFALLRRGVDEREQGIQLALPMPVFVPLHADPRWPALVRAARGE